MPAFRERVRWMVALASAAVQLVAPPDAYGQAALAPTAEWRAAPVLATWRFSSPLAQSAGDITDVRQFAVPLRARFRLQQRWTVDVTGAVSTSTVTLSDGGVTKSLSLSGLSDLNVRLTGPLAGDALMITAGVNLPTGSTELGADATTVMQTIAAPALSMPVSTLGLGLGGTVGILGAREFGAWALALGASIEQRTEYTPIALALATGQSRTTLAPGMAAHLSFGADRSVGAQRVSFLVVGDLYQDDQLTTTTGSVKNASEYALGPQVTTIGRLEFAKLGWRELAANASFRVRSEFADAAGSKVAGSGGSYLDFSVGGVRGDVASRGLILGADARHHGGLEFTNSLVGATMSAIGATVGVDWPFAHAALRVALRAQVGSLDTGTASSGIMGLQLSASLAARGGAR